MQVKRPSILILAPFDYGTIWTRKFFELKGEKGKGFPGASEAPEKIAGGLSHKKVLVAAKTQEQAHENIEHEITNAFEANYFPILIGGSNDVSIGLIRAMHQRHNNNEVVWLDPHLDVRPFPEIDGKERFLSGSPLYAAINESQAHSIHAFGADENKNQAEEWQWASKRLEIHQTQASNAAEKFSRLLKKINNPFSLHLDMDCVDEKHAPGVSARNKSGYSEEEIIQLIRLAARHPKLTAIDITEVVPSRDADGKTVELARKVIHTLEENRGRQGRYTSGRKKRHYVEINHMSSYL